MSILSCKPHTAHRAPLIVIGLLAMTIALAACGKKAPVQPRLTSLPAAPAELLIAQQGEDFLLSWTLPERNQDGTAVEDLIGFHVYRMTYDAAEGCPTCRDPEELVAAIQLTRPEPAVRFGRHLYWRDIAPAPGTGQAYLVVPVTTGGHEGASIGAYRIWLQPPPAPTALRAEVGDRQVRLSWSPPATLPEGQILLGYNLYRRQAAGGYSPMALNAEPLREPKLIDFVGEGGRDVSYRVTSLVRSGDQLLESAPSDEALVTRPGAR
jgi:hypothetical protein